MKMRRLSVALALGAMMVLLSACSVSFSTASISGAQFARGYSNGKAVGATSAFRPTDNPLHLVVTLSNAPDGTTIKAVWIAVDAGGAHDYRLGATTLTTSDGQDTADFTLSLSHAWPTGRYKVDLYLNAKRDRTVTFRVG